MVEIAVAFLDRLLNLIKRGRPEKVGQPAFSFQHVKRIWKRSLFPSDFLAESTEANYSDSGCACNFYEFKMP